ncbi:MAG: hypothetical protein LBS52_08140 [Dysgonamonadaceae bacterium]|jgi:hypothetical protein|nr:hypothetical protein [Dysgonamonadaceae bacterium]
MKTKVFPNDVFFEEVIARVNEGEHVYIHAKGYSMTPFILNNKDKVVLAKPDETSVAKGNILLVRLNNGRFILHRVESVSGDEIVLRGDGNVSGREHCRRENVLAEVAGIIKNNRSIKKGSPRWKRYERLWPSNSLARRILLMIYRKIFGRGDEDLNPTEPA